MKVGIYKTIGEYIKFNSALTAFFNSIDIEVVNLHHNKIDVSCDIIILSGYYQFKHYKKYYPEQEVFILYDPIFENIRSACSINCNGLFNKSGWFGNSNINSDRWDSKKYRVKPWRLDGDTVLLVLEPPAYLTYKDKRDYNYTSVLEELLDLKFKVKVRNHPHNINRRITKYVEHINPQKESLLTSFEDSFAVVGFKSKALVTSVLEGIPTVSLSDHSYVKGVSMDKVEQLNSVAFFDRKAWCNSIAHGFWTVEEILSGTFWEAYSKTIAPGKNKS